MNRFKEEKRLNFPKFAPAAGYFGIRVQLLPILRDKSQHKFGKEGVIKIEGGS